MTEIKKLDFEDETSVLTYHIRDYGLVKEIIFIKEKLKEVCQAVDKLNEDSLYIRKCLYSLQDLHEKISIELLIYIVKSRIYGSS